MLSPPHLFVPVLGCQGAATESAPLGASETRAQTRQPAPAGLLGLWGPYGAQGRTGCSPCVYSSIFILHPISPSKKLMSSQDFSLKPGSSVSLLQTDFHDPHSPGSGLDLYDLRRWVLRAHLSLTCLCVQLSQETSLLIVLIPLSRAQSLTWIDCPINDCHTKQGSRPCERSLTHILSSVCSFCCEEWLDLCLRKIKYVCIRFVFL